MPTNYEFNIAAFTQNCMDIIILYTQRISGFQFFQWVKINIKKMTIERIVHWFFSLELYPRSFTAILNSGVKSFCLSQSTCYTFSLSRGYPLFSQISVLGKKKIYWRNFTRYSSQHWQLPDIELSLQGRCHCKKHQTMYEK